LKAQRFTVLSLDKVPKNEERKNKVFAKYFEFKSLG
jgi:hypothetical protein